MPRSQFASIVILFCIFSIESEHALAQCEIGWSRPVQEDYPGEGIPRAEFDEDGNGPNPPWTIFSGYVYSAGGIPVTEMAAWNGTYWQPFPGSIVPTATVYAMLAVDEDGPGPEKPVLWAGGTFTSINGVAAGKVARYDHGAWHGIADGIPAFPFGDIRQFVAFDPDGNGPMPPVIYARANAVAQLNGNGWESLGEGTIPPTTAITGLVIADLDGDGPEQPALVRTGRFTPQSSIGEVQKWTGIQWERIGSEFSKSPVDPVLFDPDQNGPLAPELYVGGNYQSIGVTTARGIARWRNNEWQPLEIQLVGAPIVSTRLWVGDDDGEGPRPPSLFVSGEFALPGATNSVIRNSARWDGKKWEGLGAISEGSPYGIHMNIRGQRVFRWFISAYPGGSPFPYFVREQSGWRAASYSSYHTTLRKLAAIDMDGSDPMSQSIVIVGDNVDPICDGVAKSAASWNGRTWTPLANAEPPGAVNSICMFDFDDAGPAPPQLIFAGRFTFNGLSYATVVLQNGVWVPIPSSLLTGGVGSNEYATCLTVYDSDGDGPAAPMLMLGGKFHSLGQNPGIAYLARWTPQGWAPISPPLDRAVVSMHVHDDDGDGPIPPALYVAGPMLVGSIAVNGIAQWDGLNWHPLVDAMTGEIPTINPAQTMCSLQEESGQFSLCVGGNFFMPQGLVHAARWKNSHWLPMGVTLPSSITRMVALPETNSGINNSLYCLASEGINYPKNLYQWNGQDWQKLTNYSLSGGMEDMTAIDFDGNGPALPQLCVYGAFSSIPYGNPVNGTVACIALWGPRQPFYFATPWDRSIAAGDRLSLKVATGDPETLTFAWTRDGVTLADGGAVSGATTRELVINPVAFGDSGQYECIATNACGSIPSGPTLVRVCESLANGDLNSDGHIDGLDISPFVAMWTSPLSPESDCAVDLTHNGVRDPDDIAWFIGRLLSP